MQKYSQIEPLVHLGSGGTAVAMGYFDGIHIGHRAVIEGAAEWARAHGAEPALFTFKLPPNSRMKGKRLIALEDKLRLIEQLGVEHYIEPEFDAIKDQTPEEFVQSIVQNCKARALFCGENFTFGARAAGDPEMLRELCKPLGVEVIVVPMAQFEGKTVSSTRIRVALEGGDIPAANTMLGMPYAIRFAVQHGQGLGRTLGVPTINQLYPVGFQMPRFGIYITRTNINGVWYPSATGLGTRPTVNQDETQVTCETFIPGFEGDLYDSAPVVEFYSYLSPSKKFDTLEQLRACIEHAAKRAEEYFADQA
jgi:riboflavin kinase/FMN adenylyltransferase